MDGKGRWLDNVYVERLWRSLKQEEVYRRAYETVAEARKGITDRYFNEERPHQGLDPRRRILNENRCPRRHNPTRRYTGLKNCQPFSTTYRNQFDPTYPPN